MKDYLTIEGFAEDEFVEKKSRFIGYAKHVETEEEAVSFINEMKQKHWDATHNVYAYVLRDGQTRRYSDDGEPQGTAGIPTLDVILKEGVVDVCVVVTRYFGESFWAVAAWYGPIPRGAGLPSTRPKSSIWRPVPYWKLQWTTDFTGSSPTSCQSTTLRPWIPTSERMWC